MLVTTQAGATSIAARARARLIRAGRVDTRRQIRLATTTTPASATSS